MSIDKIRAEFEAWITSPPYEKPVAKYAWSGSWPGQYQSYEVQLAWEAYRASRAGLEIEMPPLPQEAGARSMHYACRRALERVGVRVKP